MFLHKRDSISPSDAVASAAAAAASSYHWSLFECELGQTTSKRFVGHYQRTVFAFFFSFSSSS